MHLEILIEDESGKRALEILVPKIISDEHTFRIISYKGIGRIPKNLSQPLDASKRILLSQLPKLLKGYGQTFSSYTGYSAAVIVVCDLDNKSLKDFKNELKSVLNGCNPKPQTEFCFAIEEGEAWFLGDITAICNAYPKAKKNILNNYQNDSICGTWETLADAIYEGGHENLKSKGWQSVGAEKSKWATFISPHMNIDNNLSDSFNYFKQTLQILINEEN